jgi:ribonuclease E
MRPSLGDSTQLPCPRCKGQGTIRNVESVALSVLRILEEEAMKKGTEKVIAHLPIECATFLLNEKRHAIEQIEQRLKIGIIILPSKHLETPAYDIERIKEKEFGDERPSYLQIKTEDIAVPDFAQQIKPKIERAVIKEFMHDSPAPVQAKSEAASLIKRFWNKLLGSDTVAVSEIAEDVKTLPAISSEAPRSGEEGQPNRNRNNRRGGRNQGQKNQESRPPRAAQEPRPERAPREPRPERVAQEPKSENISQEQVAKPEQNKEPRARNMRGPGRNVRRNLAPANVAVEGGLDIVENQLPVVNEALVVETSGLAQEVSIDADDQAKPAARKNNNRRGPNRRRPRNPNYKKAEGEGDAVAGDTTLVAVDSRSEDRGSQSRSYNSGFAERVEKTESSESKVSEPQKVANESTPKAVED